MRFFVVVVVQCIINTEISAHHIQMDYAPHDDRKNYDLKFLTNCIPLSVF